MSTFVATLRATYHEKNISNWIMSQEVGQIFVQTFNRVSVLWKNAGIMLPEFLRQIVSLVLTIDVFLRTVEAIFFLELMMACYVISKGGRESKRAQKHEFFWCREQNAKYMMISDARMRYFRGLFKKLQTTLGKIVQALLSYILLLKIGKLAFREKKLKMLFCSIVLSSNGKAIIEQLLMYCTKFLPS